MDGVLRPRTPPDRPAPEPCAKLGAVNRFEALYQGTPLWEIGRVQPFIEQLVARGALTGDVLDVGCGTGENALYLAAQGQRVVGIDVSPTAVRKAQEKARSRHQTEADFQVGDALELAALGRTFDVIIDSAVFHVFPDDLRPRYAHSLSKVCRPGTQLYLACFSEREPDWGGPRRVTQAEIRATFGEPWEVEGIEPVRYHLNAETERAEAWLATIVFVG